MEHLYDLSFIRYLVAYDWWTFLLLIGEVAGFVVIALHVIRNSHWVFHLPLTFLFGGAWIILYEFALFDFILYWKGSIP